MRKVLLSAAILTAITGWSTSSDAAIGSLDAVPAATLLIPYFEVDLANADGANTVISVQNTDTDSQLTNVVIWSDVGIPVSSFNLRLSGNGMYVMNLRNIISPAAGVTADPELTTCNIALPPSAGSSGSTQDLQSALTGQARALDGKCFGMNHNDQVARGYITIDTVSACTASNPSQANYFVAGGTGVATNQNILVGDYFWSNPSQNFIHSEVAVHLEADSTNAYTSVANIYTFYGRFVNWSAADNREPAVQAWGVPYVNDKTDMIVWQDSRMADANPFACNTPPTWINRAPSVLAAFDDQEQFTALTASAPLGLAASRVHIGGAAGLSIPYETGWLSLSMNTEPLAGSPLPDATLTQGYVVALQYPKSTGNLRPFTAGSVATAFASATVQLPSNYNFGYDAVNGYRANGTAYTNFGAVDITPGATTLIPYFEVDLDDDNGANTVATLLSSTATAILVDATLWTDMGVRSSSFSIYLTGYDTTTIDLRLLFKAGIVSQTASAGQEYPATVSPTGPHSQHINYPTCDGFLPVPMLPADKLTHLRNAHTGKASSVWNGQCGSVPLGDNVARGYMTFDVVSQCSMPPADSNMRYANNAGMTTYNFLSGSYMVTNRDSSLAYGARMISLSTPTGQAAVNPNQYTFYGAYTAGPWDASDKREPLPSAWRVHFNKSQNQSPYGSVANANSYLIVWRDTAMVNTPFTCGQAPGSFPLTHNSIVAFDEQDNSTTLPATPFLRVANRIPLQSSNLNIPYDSGFLVMDLTARNETAQGPAGEPNMRQSFVGIVQQADAAHLSTMQSGFPVAYPF